MGHKHRPAPHPSPSRARPSPRMRGEGFKLALLARLVGTGRGEGPSRRQFPGCTSSAICVERLKRGAIRRSIGGISRSFTAEVIRRTQRRVLTFVPSEKLQ